MTYWKYGSYQHPSAEVNLAKMDISYRPSPRGKRIERVDRFHLFGQFCEDSTSEVVDRIEELIAAYDVDYQDCGLYLDDDTLTPHNMSNAASVSGVRVLHRSWDGGREELATTRTFDIVLQVVYPEVEDQLVEWHETVEIIGTGGPRFKITDTYFGPIATQVAEATAQTIIQYGNCVGYGAHIPPPGPLYSEYEHVDRRRIVYASGKNAGRIATHYPTAWTYHHTLPAPETPFPLTV